MYTINMERFKRTFERLSEIGATLKGGLNRTALSREDQESRDMFCSWMEEAGLEVRVDDVGNYYGHRKGEDETLAPVVLGSHLDTVYRGGRYDGITGVQAALEVIRTMNDLEIKTRRPVEIAVFTNEEGVRFEPSMLGSGVLAGVFDIEDIYRIKDRDGFTFGEELRKIGYRGLKENRLREVDTYLEMHVEQGPVLEKEEKAIGVLEGIRGMVHLEITIRGTQDHAGPSPMEYRKDSMMGAAAIIARTEKIAYETGHGTTVTVGKIKVNPCCSNVIPLETQFSVDVRNEEDSKMNEAIESIKTETERICAERGLTYEIEEFWRVNAIHFPKRLVDKVEEAVKARGYSYKRMMSGAGHDASYMFQIAQTAMIFVPSIGGLSHCEEEKSDYGDIEKGANVLLDVTLQQAGL